MKLEQLRPFFGQYVAVQFRRDHEIIAVAHQSTLPDGRHLCKLAMHTEASGDVAVPIGATDLLESVVLAAAMFEGDARTKENHSPTLVLTYKGPDGSLLQTACDPESIMFVTFCGEPPPVGSKIVVP